ncbi:importin [Ophiostoma piceae UAMH 11346]|uniref:Importin n=1 Tax=Ophiostoma piceae (strain UAMH 11346) TaxID=1262450 RepID=S3C5D1_OPHP1|nr:importin [Ophiostoma piceae UAMH 11346]
MDNQAPLPTSLAEVESLILALYSHQTSHTDIASIQDTLQRLQRSPEGWRLAQTFIDRPVRSTTDDQIKFFGALTIIIKLNTESSALSPEDAGELLQNLLRWLATSSRDESGFLSTQKLCQALVTFFIHFSSLWPRCIKSLLLSLRTGNSVVGDDVDRAPSVSEIVAGLDWRLMRVALLFANNLVTDVGKTDMRLPKFSAVHAQLLQNAADAAELIHVGLASPVSDPAKTVTIRRESIKCLQSWILYAQRLPLNSSETLIGPLRSLINPVVICLQDDELYDAAIELLSDILSNYSNFFTADHYDSIASIFESEWGEKHMQALLGGDFDFEPLQYGLLLLAYGDARVETLMTTPASTDGGRSQKILASLSALLTAAGHPVAEDFIFVPALEFWATYIETMLDSMYSDADDGSGGQYAPWVESALVVVKEVVGRCWAKIQYPPIKEFMSWDSSDRAGFGDARKDVGDLLQTVFTVAGRDLLTIFTDLLLQSINDKAWSQIEATAFCLAALSDCVSDDANYDGILESIFSSPLFSLLALGESQLPVRLRQTALSLIERYSEYFERKPAHLPAALNLLFEAVATPPLAMQASKAISTLCSSCRALLTPEASAFLRQYQMLHDNPQLDSLAEERIVYAISAIIQSTPDETTRLQLSEQLLSYIVRDVELCLRLHRNEGTNSDLDTNSPLIAKAVRQCQQQQQQKQPQSQESQLVPSTNEVLLQAVLIPLRCLASMARGLQSTTEAAIELDSDDDVHNGSERAPTGHPQLQSLQSTIMSMILAIQSVFPRSSEVVDVICSIFKAGFSEAEPGPLVFPPEMVTEMLVHQSGTGGDATKTVTPYIGSIVNTAHSFVSSLANKNASSAAAAKSLGTLVPWIFGLLQQLPEPEADTELTQRGIEFVDCVMQKNAAALLRLEPSSQLEYFFMFTLKVLDGNEPLPKAAAAEFWSTFITLRPEEDLKASVSNAMEHLGPLLSRSLINNFGGNASRSELDKLADPLKKMVVQHVRAQSWLEQALTASSFPSDRVTASEKAVFLKKIMNLRGSRQTNTVVREFWLACRGSSFSYAS